MSKRHYLFLEAATNYERMELGRLPEIDQISSSLADCDNQIAILGDELKDMKRSVKKAVSRRLEKRWEQLLSLLSLQSSSKDPSFTRSILKEAQLIRLDYR